MYTLVLRTKSVDSYSYVKIGSNVISTWLKDFLLLDFSLTLLFSFLFAFPLCSSPRWVALGLLRLELSEEHLGHICASFHIRGFISMCNTLIQAPNGGTRVKLSFDAFLSSFFKHKAKSQLTK